MRFRPLPFVVPLLAFAACTDRPTVTPVDPEPPKPDLPSLGIYRFTFTGIGTSDMSGSVARIDGGGARLSADVNLSLSTVGAGLGLELLSASSFTEGRRDQGGQRYINFVYRIRNSTGAPVTNLAFLPVTSASTKPGTPYLQVSSFDGTALPDSFAAKIVPTGAVALGPDARMVALYPDVLQAFTEAEVAAITLPSGKTGIFPYGYTVRNTQDPTTRTLPVAINTRDFGGTITLPLRLPLTGSSTTDAFTIVFDAVAIQDSETRLTETIEEGQDTAAVRRIRELATAMSATTVTVLNGSGRMDPAVPDYPGQRQICSLRTAGTPGSPTNFINAPGPLSNYAVYLPGESLDACAANFRSGTAGRPATNTSFVFTARAMDRYGNVRSVPNDTVQIRMASGSPPFTASPPKPLVDGVKAINVIFSDYGNATFSVLGARLLGTPTSLVIAGVTRTWTAGAGTTDWHTGANWGRGAVPMYLDSVYIPAAPSGGAFFPALAQNVSILGVNVENGATIAIGGFNLTAGSNVATGTSGGITNSSGTLYLTGSSKTVHGLLPRVRVLGTYSLSGNVTARAPVRVELGRLRSASYRVRAASY